MSNDITHSASDQEPFDSQDNGRKAALTEEVIKRVRELFGYEYPEHSQDREISEEGVYTEA